MPYIELPNKEWLRVPKGLNDEQALSYARAKAPFLYKELDRGIGERAVSAAGEGFKQLGETASGLSAGVQSLFGGKEGVQKYIDEQKKEQEESGKKPRALTLQNLIDQYKSEGVLPALSNVPAYVTENILQSAPSMAVPLAAGAATTAYSAPLLGPLAPVAGTLAGMGTYALQSFAANTQRQAQTPGRTAETMEPGKALGAAAVAAPVGFLVDRWTLGLGKVSTKAAAALMEKELVARGVGKTLAVGAAKGLLEAPTELLETAIERAQAGLSLTDKDAKAEFLETLGSALAVGPTAGAGFAYRERGQAKAGVEEAAQATAMQERNQARMDALKQDQEQKLSPEYRDTLLQERAPLMQRMDELKAIKKAAGKNGKDLDPNEYAALQDELKTVGQNLAANTRSLKEIDAPIPLEQGKKSMAQIQEELRVKAETEQQAALKEAADKAEAARLKAPPQADMFGTPVAGKYAELPPESMQRITGLRAPEAAVEEAPNLPEEYRKAKAESNRLADTMEAASAKKDWTGYEAARTQRVPFEDSIKALEAEATKQQISLVPQPPTPAPTVEDINKKIQKLADQGKSVASLLPQLEAAKTAPVQQQIQGLEPQDIATHQKTIAEAKAAAEKEAKERGLITDDFGNIVSGKETQQLGLNISAAERAQAQSLATPVMEDRSRAQKHIDEGRITPEVSKYLGLDVSQKYDLSQPEQAQQALPIVSARIATLSAQSRDLSQQGEHVANGRITPSGNKLLEMEGKIKELQRLQQTAQDSAPTQTEERLVSNIVATSPVTAPAPEAVEPGIARIRGDKAEQERRAALADFVESVDTLRKGDFTDVPKNEVIREATELTAKYVDAMLREAAYRRMERQRGSVTQDEAIKAASAVDARLQKLIDEAASRPREAPGMLGSAIEKATEPQSKIVFEAARAVAKLQERIRKAGPNVNVAELRTQLAEARQRFEEEKAKYLPSQRKQDEIKRGMTISETQANFGNTEYAKIRGELGRVAYELAYPSGKKQVAKTPFELKPSPAAAPARAATDVNTLRPKVEALLSKKDISAEDLRTVRTLQAQIAQSEATQAGGKDRITELRGQVDTLSNEMARLKKQYEASKKINERKRLRKLGARYNEALSKANAEILALRGNTGVGERPGVSEGDTVDMFKKLERQEEAAQRRGEEKKETYSPAVKVMFAEATKLRKNLHSLFDSTIKKYDAAVKDLTARYKQYEGIGSYANKFAQEAAAAQAVKDKALKGINTGLTRANRLLEKAEELHTQETAVAEKKKSVEEAQQKKAEEKRRKAQAKPAAKPAPVAKEPTVAEAEKALQEKGTTRRYEVTDVERVKRLPEGTELADIEADRDELSQKIRALGAQLGLEPRAALRPKLERTLPTERERKINNSRLGLIEKYEELGRQLVMPVREKIEAKEKPVFEGTAQETASRVIPREYAKALFDVQQVRDALKQKGVPPSKRKELEAKRGMLNSKIMALEARAKTFDVDLSIRAKPEETALAQAKAVREGLAAAERQPPKRDPYLKTGSEEQKQSKAEGAERKKRGRQAKKGIEYEETEADIRNEESAILAGLVGHGSISESRGSVTNPSNKDTVYKELSRAFKGKAVSDRVTVYNTVAEARAANPDYADEMHKDTRGFTIKGEVSLIAENIEKGNALSVLLHELGVHVGFRNFFNPKEFNALVNVVKQWAGRKDNSLEAQVGRAAMARVEEAQTNKKQFDDELLAYAVEEAVALGLDPAGLKSGSPVRNWFNRLVKAFRSALEKLGLAPETLTAQNLVDFAYGTANIEMGRGGYHGTGKSFTAFDLRKSGTGEGSVTDAYNATRIGAGPYVGIGGKDRYGRVDSRLGRRTAEHYQYSVPFMQELGKFKWGNTTYTELQKEIGDTEGTPFSRLKLNERAAYYKQALLGAYAEDVFSGGEVNPSRNKGVLEELKRIKERDATLKLPEITLDPDNIEPFTGTPPVGKMYATLDNIPDKQIYDLNSYIKPGENPKEDALVEAYGSAEDRRQFKYDAKKVAAGEKSYGVGFPRNSLFFDLVRVHGPDDAALMLKEAGYRAIQRKTDMGRMRERAYIEEAPEILAEMAGTAMGEAEEILFSRSKAKMPAGFEAVQDFAAAAIAKEKGMLATIKSRSKKQNALAFKVAEIDRLAAIEEMADQAIKAGNSNEAMQMMYFLQKQLDMLSMASASAYTGALDLVEENGEFRIQAKEGASLRTTDQALKPLIKMGFNAEGAENLFTAYIASLRGEQEGYNKLNFDPEVIKMAQEVVPNIKANQEVKDVLDLARAEYNEYNKGQIRFLEKTGAIKPEVAAELLKKKDFIPFYRDVGGQLSLFIGSGVPIKLGNLKSQPHLQKLVGGDEKIMSYFESSMQNTLILTDLSLRNLATKNTAHAFHTFGVLETTKGSDGKEHAIRLGDGPANANVLHFKDKGVEKHVVVKTEGTAYEHIPTELLVKGMEGTAIVMPKAIEMLSVPAQFLRKGITLNPLYPYYQLVKDSMAMGVTRGVSFSSTASVMKGIKQFVNGDALIKELQAKGVIYQAELFTGTMADVAKIRNRVLEGEGKLAKFVSAQEARAVKADGAVRAMLYSHYVKEGLSPRDAEYMTVKAMPYSRRGVDPALRYLSQMVPFFNAQIVGLYSLYQSMRGQGPMSGKLQIKKKLYTAGMGMAISTLVYSALVSGEDWYENTPLETRLRNWLIKLPGSQEPIAIPIPFEFGILFKALFEATYMGAFKDSPEGTKVLEAVKSLAVGTIPKPIPTAVGPLVSLWANKDSFSGNPIEGERDLGVDPAERFRDTTSELSKRLGRMGGVSPLQLDYLIRGYTGTVGPAVVALVDAFTGPANAAAGVKQELPASKLPLLSQLFKPVDGGALIDLAVDSLKKADQTRKTYEKLANDGRNEEAEAYLAKNIADIERGKLAGKLRQRLGLYSKAERDIKASDSTPLEKRRALEDLKQSKIQESKEFMQEFRAGG